MPAVRAPTPINLFPSIAIASSSPKGRPMTDCQHRRTFMSVNVDDPRSLPLVVSTCRLTPFQLACHSHQHTGLRHEWPTLSAVHCTGLGNKAPTRPCSGTRRCVRGGRRVRTVSSYTFSTVNARLFVITLD